MVLSLQKHRHRSAVHALLMTFVRTSTESGFVFLSPMSGAIIQVLNLWAWRPPRDNNGRRRPARRRAAGGRRRTDVEPTERGPAGGRCATRKSPSEMTGLMPEQNEAACCPVSLRARKSTRTVPPRRGTGPFPCIIIRPLTNCLCHNCQLFNTEL